ncbi:hypothetical protein [Pseudophaeobacter arcticus]|jgi:hypothetical protein|uniref:hypothetical protein n=1 Tax=Pseudophaeobacter arcticus TaxID=385492 RepID=UPI0039E52E1A
MDPELLIDKTNGAADPFERGLDPLKPPPKVAFVKSLLPDWHGVLQLVQTCSEGLSARLLKPTGCQFARPCQ